MKLANTITSHNKKIECSDVEMPNLIGLTPKDVIYIFKDLDINIKIKGTGLVEKQFPEAGETLEGVEEIRVILK